jgi:hypothetical protein
LIRISIRSAAHVEIAATLLAAVHALRPPGSLTENDSGAPEGFGGRGWVREGHEFPRRVRRTFKQARSLNPVALTIRGRDSYCIGGRQTDGKFLGPESPLPPLAGFEFVAEDIATHDHASSTFT